MSVEMACKDRVMGLAAAAKWMRGQGYACNARALWRLCKQGRLAHSVLLNRIYVSEADLLASVEFRAVREGLRVEPGRSGRASGMSAGHLASMRFLKQEGVFT